MDFIDNMRLSKMLNAYKGADNEATKRLQKELETENIRRNAAGALGTALQGLGTWSATSGWGAGPVVGAVGAAAGAPLMFLGGNAILQSERAYGNKRKSILDEMQRENNNSWIQYKNDALAKATNGQYTVGKLAAMGKMMDDAGNIIDIDYDYYSTVPYETLTRVFGEDGANAVRDAISRRK